MSPNLISLTLSVGERRSLSKMGDKSEAFCRQTLTVLVQNPQVVPASLDLAEAQRDLLALDHLRSRTSRLQQLLGRVEDTEMPSSRATLMPWPSSNGVGLAIASPLMPHAWRTEPGDWGANRSYPLTCQPWRPV